MTADTIELLDALYAQHPHMRASEGGSPSEIEAASNAVGVDFPIAYRKFLIRYGAGLVGPYPVFGLRPVDAMGNPWSVVDATSRYRRQGIAVIDGWAVVSEDHGGNPVGIDVSGTVWLFDHDFGGATRLRDSFEQYVRLDCLKLDV